MKPLSLYIHFPFCIKKCRYCDFYSISAEPLKIAEYSAALKQEIKSTGNQFKDSTVTSIYIGGGSPNLMPREEFTDLINTVRDEFNVSETLEFTVEMNPANHNIEFLKTLSISGVNRINVGAQSFVEEELNILGRVHSIKDTIATVGALDKIGYEHIGLDLIYGIPGQTMESWCYSLESALKLNVDHLSLYNLSYEEGTELSHMLKQGKIQALDVEIEKQFYLKACRILAERGFHHYEISNWAKPGCESRHNRAYWEGGVYLGYGPSAHSFDGHSRWWNVRSVEKYIERINNRISAIENSENLTEQDREIEQLFLRLRTSNGLSRSQFENIFHLDFKRIVRKLEEMKISEEYWIFDGNTFKLTPAGWFVSDSIIYTILSYAEEIRNDHKKGRIGFKS